MLTAYREEARISSTPAPLPDRSLAHISKVDRYNPPRRARLFHPQRMGGREFPRNDMTGQNPFESLRQIYAGYAVSRALHAVADLGVADALDDSPRSATDLARSVDANPDALDRALRILSSYGVFEPVGDGYRHSPASRLLRSDHPGSARALARMFGLSMNWSTYGAMEHTMRTGRPASEKTLPEGFWGYFSKHPEESAIFNEAMAAKARAQVPAVVAAYDFSRFRRIGDIGGGRGHLLQAVLRAAPQAKGVLFDLPHVVADAASSRSDRLTLQAGDFFKDALPECDAYVLMEVIHDWADPESEAILRSIRRAAPVGAVLLLIEEIIPTDPGPHWSKLLDLHMLTLLGGRQRTLHQYERLLRTAGFAPKREIATPVGISIIEAAAE